MLRITLEYDCPNEQMIIREGGQELAVLTRCEIASGKLDDYLQLIVSTEHECKKLREIARDISSLDA